MELTRILVGMHDYGTGIDPVSFTVTADFPIDDVKPGENVVVDGQPRLQQGTKVEVKAPARSPASAGAPAGPSAGAPAGWIMLRTTNSRGFPTPRT